MNSQDGRKTSEESPVLVMTLMVSGRNQEDIVHLVYGVETEVLYKILNAHFQRIIEIKSLVVGNDNAVLTSSIDRSIKVWNLNYIFEKEQHIDKHELTIDSLSISTNAEIAVVVTRSCIGKTVIFIILIYIFCL